MAAERFRRVAEVIPEEGSASSVLVVLECGHEYRDRAAIAPEVGERVLCRSCAGPRTWRPS